MYASGADLESANPLVTIHPLSQQVQRHALLVTLARRDSTLEPRPYYARSWSWSDDRRQLTLQLTPGLSWHDGVPTTARDVVFTFEAARDPRTGYPRYGDLASLERIEAAGDSTVVFSFRDAQPALPAVLADLPILPAHILEGVARPDMRRAAFNLAPIGNGPFRFVSRDPGARWVFERDDAFPPAMGGPPRLRRLVIAVVDEATTKFAGLVSGELDVAGIAPTMAELADSDPSLRVISYPVLFATGIIFNTTRPPFDSRAVRHAVSLAIDRERIIAAALAGFAIPASGPVHPENPFALAGDAGPDPARARALLDSAGWRDGADDWRVRDGERLEFELLTVGSGNNAVEQLVQADLAAVGIDMQIRQMEMGAFLAHARAADRDFDALLTGVPGDLSLSYIAAMHDSRLAGGALDYGGFHTSTLDSLFSQLRSASDAERVGLLWRAVQRELAREMPAAWVYHARGVAGVSERLRGVRMDLRGEMATLQRWHVVPAPR